MLVPVIITGTSIRGTRHATSSTVRGTARSVQLLHDGVGNTFEVLLHGLKLLLLGIVGSVKPLHDLVDLVGDSLHVVLAEGGLRLLLTHGVLHGVAVRLEAILGLDPLGSSLVLISELLGLTHHALNVVLGQTTLVVGDGDVCLLARGTLVFGGNVEHTVGVELELAEEVVVLGAGALALEHLDKHTRLVVSVGGEGLGLLGWDSGVAGDESGHHATSSLEAEGQRSDIEEEQVRVTSGATSEDTGLDGSTIGDSLIGVDATVGLLAVEKLRDELLHLGDASGSTDHDNLVHRSLVNLGVTEHLLHRLEGATEEAAHRSSKRA